MNVATGTRISLNQLFASMRDAIGSRLDRRTARRGTAT